MKLEEIKARAEAATEGPWRYCGANEERGGCDCGLVWGPDGNATVAETNTGYEGGGWDWKWEPEAVIANGKFIAHARTDIPALIAEVERLRVENKVADEVVELEALNELPKTYLIAEIKALRISLAEAFEERARVPLGSK